MDKFCEKCKNCKACDIFYSVEILPEGDGWVWYILKHCGGDAGRYVFHGHAKTISQAGHATEECFKLRCCKDVT